MVDYWENMFATAPEIPTKGLLTAVAKSDPAFLRIHSRYSLAGARILAQRDLVPDKMAIIERIGENTGSAGAVAMDGGTAPDVATAGCREIVSVQIDRNIPRCSPSDVFVKDPAHDGRLCFDNDAVAPLPGTGAYP
jgi:hypothetical protein